MSLTFDSGYASDFGKKVGTASFAMSMLREGTETRTSQDIAKELETLGTNLSTGASIDTSRLSMDSLVTNLAPSLDIFADILENASFSDDEIERKRANWLENIKREKASPNTQALRILPGLIFGDNHAYGVPLTGSGTEQSITSLTRDDLISYRDTWLRPDNARLVIVGATTEAEIKPLLEEALGEWKAPATPKPTKQFTDVAMQTKPRVYIIDQPGTPQSTIFAGHLAPADDAPNAEVLDVANTILGGSFTSRVNMNLREDKGWSYGSRTIWSAYDEAGLFFTLAPVQTDKTKESIQEILKELNQYQTSKPATAEELEKVQMNKTAKLPGAYETKGALLGAIVDTLDKGKDMAWLENYGERVNAITVEDVQSNARTLIDTDALTWVIVGDAKQIADDVRSLNLGEVTMLDSDGNAL